MTGTLKYHDGTGWVRIPWAKGDPGPVGPEGPQGPTGVAVQPEAPAETGVLWVDSDADYGPGATIDPPVGPTTTYLGRTPPGWHHYNQYNGSQPAGRLDALPIFARRDIQITGYHVEVSVAAATAGSKFRVGMSSVASEGNNMIIGGPTADMGAVDIDTPGAKTVDLSASPIVLPPGLHLLVFTASATATLGQVVMLPDFATSQETIMRIADSWWQYSQWTTPSTSYTYAIDGWPAGNLNTGGGDVIQTNKGLGGTARNRICPFLLRWETI